MRKIDIIFFVIVYTVLVILIFDLISNVNIPIDFYRFWWFILLPIALIKIFLPNSKLNKWLDSELRK